MAVVNICSNVETISLNRTLPDKLQLSSVKSDICILRSYKIHVLKDASEIHNFPK